MAQFIILRNEKIYKPRRRALSRDYKTLYRFQEENLQWLANHFLGHHEETRGGALSPELKMKTFLRYLADPGFQSGIGEELGIHQSTVSETITEVMYAVNNRADFWIRFPGNDREIQEAEAEWQNFYDFPTAIGALDCTQIAIEKPAHHGDEYICRKGFASINVQATCNAKEMFTSVCASWPGSVHDSRIWKNSNVRENIVRLQNSAAVLLADSGYGLEPWLMTPFRICHTHEENAFNRLLKKERVIIERCFGQLKRRFPIIKYVCRLRMEKLPSIIKSCFVLHNIATYLRDEDFPDEEEDEGNEDIGQEVENQGQLLERGRIRRHELANIIYRHQLQ